MTIKERLFALAGWSLLASFVFIGATVVSSRNLDDGVGVVNTASNLIKTGDGTLYAVSVSMSDYTSGDSIAFKDAITDTGTSYLTLKPTAYNSTTALYTCDWVCAKGISYQTGIYCTVTQTAGTITVNAVYK